MYSNRRIRSFLVVGVLCTLPAITVLSSCSSGPSAQDRVEFANVYQGIVTPKRPGKEETGLVDSSKTKITSGGVDNTTLMISNPDFSDVTVNVLHETDVSTGLMGTMRDKGFTKVMYSNGLRSWEFSVE